MNALIEYQKRKKLTVTEMARRAGLHKSAVSRHLRGQKMSRQSIEAYSRAFRISVSKLLGI